MPGTLPTELWIRVLSFVLDDSNDRPKLWVSGRAVCTAFKEAIETIFREKHLPKTFISYDLGAHYLDGGFPNDNDDYGPNTVVLTPKFKFSHLSADKSTAFFVAPEEHERFKPLVISNLPFALETKRFEKPSHTVQVRRELNDSPIPGVSIVYDPMTLSCDWRGLFSAFFAEELLANNIRDREMKQFNSRRTALIENVRGGQLDMVAAIQQMLAKYDNVNDEARKQARRMRIKRQYKQEGHKDWKPLEGDSDEEDDINKVLKEKIALASSRDFSDEEGGEGDEDEDDDSGEWEDEEGEESGEDEDNEEGHAGEDVDANIEHLSVS